MSYMLAVCEMADRLGYRAALFALFSARFCLRSLAAGFLTFLPPLSLFPIGASLPASVPVTRCQAIPTLSRLRRRFEEIEIRRR